MKGIIIYNSSFYGGGVKAQAEALKAEFERLKVKISVVSSDSFTVTTDNEMTATDLEKADFVVFLNKDTTMAKFLEKCGYKLFNSPFSIEICDDKALCYAHLAGNGIPLIKTVVAPMLYYGKLSDGYLDRVEKTLGYPIVVKINKSSLGEGVKLAESREELNAICAEAGTTPVIFQEFFGEKGRDLRVIVVGGKAVAAMERVNEKDFRANIELGGKGISHNLSESEKALAEKVASVLKLDYCGVDILFKGDKLKVCEVNSNAFFREISSISGKNIAKTYAEYIFAQN